MILYFSSTPPQFTPTAFLTRSLPIQGCNAAIKVCHNFIWRSFFINGKPDEIVRIYLISVKNVTI